MTAAQNDLYARFVKLAIRCGELANGLLDEGYTHEQVENSWLVQTGRRHAEDARMAYNSAIGSTQAE